MSLFDMTFETGVWEFKHKILAPIALIILMPIVVVFYGIAWVCMFLVSVMVGDRSIRL